MRLWLISPACLPLEEDELKVLKKLLDKAMSEMEFVK
jgi:hypothetical protein